MREKWKSPESIGCSWFQVSNLGRCRTRDHNEVYFSNGKYRQRFRPGRILNCSCDTRGRKLVMLFHHLVLVHRLVAECFVPNDNPQKNGLVFFRDNDVSNCMADNLYWGDKTEKGFRGRFKKNPVGIFLTKADDEKPFKVFESGSACAVFLGVRKQAVNSALSSKSNRCKGFIVRLLNDSDTESVMTKREAFCRKERLSDAIFAKEDIDITSKAVFD